MKREIAWLAVACLLLLLVHAVATKCEESTKTIQRLNEQIDVIDGRLGFIERKVDKSEEIDWFMQGLKEHQKKQQQSK